MLEESQIEKNRRFREEIVHDNRYLIKAQREAKQNKKIYSGEQFKLKQILYTNPK